MNNVMTYNVHAVDVICQHKMDGSIIPIKVRIQDEDKEYQTFQIRGYKDLTRPGERVLPNGVTTTNRIWEFECKIAVFGKERIIKLFYNIGTGIWFI